MAAKYIAHIEATCAWGGVQVLELRGSLVAPLGVCALSKWYLPSPRKGRRFSLRPEDVPDCIGGQCRSHATGERVHRPTLLPTPAQLLASSFPLLSSFSSASAHLATVRCPWTRWTPQSARLPSTWHSLGS